MTPNVALSHIKKRNDELGARISTYASGDGSIEATWYRRNSSEQNIATGDAVTEQDLTALKVLGNFQKWAHRDDDFDYDQYKNSVVKYINHQWRFVTMYQRGGRILTRCHDGQKFTVDVDKRETYGLLVRVLEEMKYYRTEHLSTKAEIKFYLENETALNEVPL